MASASCCWIIILSLALAVAVFFAVTFRMEAIYAGTDDVKLYETISSVMVFANATINPDLHKAAVDCGGDAFMDYAMCELDTHRYFCYGLDNPEIIIYLKGVVPNVRCFVNPRGDDDAFNRDDDDIYFMRGAATSGAVTATTTTISSSSLDGPEAVVEKN